MLRLPLKVYSNLIERYLRDTGLELALVQKMVRHLGGSLDVESGAGQTTFTIKFPI
jgi:signal transduction histidine kinase